MSESMSKTGHDQPRLLVQVVTVHSRQGAVILNGGC